MWSDKPIEARTAEEIEQIRTPNGIRQRIYEATFHDPLVRNVFTLAYREGLSGEDLYVLLAYHALVAKQKLEQHNVIPLVVPPRKGWNKADELRIVCEPPKEPKPSRDTVKP
jgi:hypothetical protein